MFLLDPGDVVVRVAVDAQVERVHADEGRGLVHGEADLLASTAQRAALQQHRVARVAGLAGLGAEHADVEGLVQRGLGLLAAAIRALRRLRIERLQPVISCCCVGPASARSRRRKSVLDRDGAGLKACSASSLRRARLTASSPWVSFSQYITGAPLR